MRHSGASFAAVLAAAAVALGQTGEKPSSISGTVTNSLTGEPVIRAHVTVQCSTAGPLREMQRFGALSNGEGKFSVTQLPPGNCTLHAERIGFVALPASGAYQLSGGTQKEGVKLTVTPAGAIVGRVLDSAGEPVLGAQVVAEWGGGTMAGTATDDRGQFRIGGLRAGKYRVKAIPQFMALPPEIRSDGSPDYHHAATYFPDSLSSKGAQKLEVRAGAEISGVDIRLVRTPIVMVSGKVTGVPAGAKNVVVTAKPVGRGNGVREDGSFAIWQLDPGKYTLEAESYSGQPRLRSAPLEIEVSTVNLEHLELRMIPAFDVPGQMRFEDEKSRQPVKPPAQGGEVVPANISMEQRRAVLNPLQQEDGQTAAPIGADDSFTLEAVQAGQYRVAISWGTGYVKSVRLGDRETEGDLVDLRNGPAGPLTIAVSSNMCEVSGTVSDAQGPVVSAPVVLSRADVPSDMRVSNTDSSGAFKFDGLRPGKYKLVPMDEGAAGWEFRGGDFEDYGDVLENLDLSAGDKVTKNLKRRK